MELNIDLWKVNVNGGNKVMQDNKYFFLVQSLFLFVNYCKMLIN